MVLALPTIRAAVLTLPTLRNLLTKTEQFDNAAWTVAAVTVAANAVAAPDGLTTADTLVETATTAQHGITQGVALTAGQTVTLSCFFKVRERTFAVLRIGDSTTYTAYYNLTTGAAGTVTAGATNAILALGGGWFRCSLTRTIANTGSRLMTIGMATADGTGTYAGNTSNGIHVWGAQLALGAQPGAYRGVA